MIEAISRETENPESLKYLFSLSLIDSNSNLSGKGVKKLLSWSGSVSL